MKKSKSAKFPSKRKVKTLVGSAAWLRSALRESNVGLWDWHFRTNYVYLSPEWKRQLGYEAHEIDNRYEEWESRLHPDDRELTLATVAAYRKQPWANYEEEFRLRHKDGSYRWILTHASLIRDDAGKPVRMVGSHIDITERKRVEGELRQMSKVFMDSADPIVIRDLEGKIIDLNTEAERAYGWRREELVGQRIEMIVPPERHSEVDELIERCKRGETVRNIEFVRWNKAGERVPILLTLSPLMDETGMPVAIATMVKHITELKQAEDNLRANEAALRQSEQRLRALMARFLAVQEEERKSLSRDLHDHLSQSLASLGLEIAMLGKEPPSSPGEMRAKLKIIETGIADMAEDVHDMARLLHPPHLDDLGLVAAINMECTNFSMRNKIPIEFKPQHVPDSLSEDVSVNLYRIIQECLRNIVKHAEAT